MPTTASKLDRARMVFDAIEQRPQLQERLSAIGYDATAIQAGRALYTAATIARTGQRGAHAHQLASTATVRHLRGQARRNYNDLASIARYVFVGQVDVLETLGLRQERRSLVTQSTSATSADESATTASDKLVRTTRRSYSQAELLDRARLLYTNALEKPMILAELTQVGYTAERLESEQQVIAALEHADTAQEGAKADAVSTTAMQREALSSLNAWLVRFNVVVSVMLRDAPELLRSMGLRARR